MNFQSCALNVLVGFRFFGGCFTTCIIEEYGTFKGVNMQYVNMQMPLAKQYEQERNKPLFHLMPPMSCYLLRFTSLILKSSVRSSISLSALVGMFITQNSSVVVV